MANESAGSRRTRNIVAGLLALLVGIGAGAVVSTQVGKDDDQAAGEIILAPAADPGSDPFTQPVSAAPDPKLAQAATPLSAPVTVAAGAATTATAGGTPGLYGGTKDKAACDPQKMVDFLAANPAKAQAWVDALNADPEVALPDGSKLTVATIPDYVATLTPLVLREDTRVTNHGFKNGKANPLQSVLQKGTAVLVDTKGVPRSKCFCGNPLTPAVASKVAPKYTGSKWPDFDPTKISFIQQNTTVINNFIVTDLATGKTFTLKAGSPVTAPTTTTTSTTAATPTTAATTTTAAATTTAPPTTTAAPTTTIGAAPVLSNGVVTHDPGNDPACATYGAGIQYYVIGASFTDADGDGKGSVTISGAPAGGDLKFTGDGSSGSFSSSICALPGDLQDIQLTDAAGHASNVLTVTAP